MAMVQGTQPRGNSQGHTEGLLVRELAAQQQGGQILSRNERIDERGGPVGQILVADETYDVRMVNRGSNLDLSRDSKLCLFVGPGNNLGHAAPGARALLDQITC